MSMYVIIDSKVEDKETYGQYIEQVSPMVRRQKALRSLLSRFAAYIWTGPNTAFGVVAGLIVLCLGGRCRFVSGAAEIYGGLAGRFLGGPVGSFRLGALTLGHVIFGASGSELSALRLHEQVHVRQYERWGLFFLPAYVLSSLWELTHGRSPYRDNFFERQAFASEAELKPRGI